MPHTFMAMADEKYFRACRADGGTRQGIDTYYPRLALPLRSTPLIRLPLLRSAARASGRASIRPKRSDQWNHVLVSTWNVPMTSHDPTWIAFGRASAIPGIAW